MEDPRLRVFVTVVDKGSFSKAARELHVTQPAVSLQVQNLEQYYGTRLLERDTVTLTPAGKVLYKYARQILDLYGQAGKEISEMTGLVRGRLVVGASTTIGEYVLPCILGDFRKKYPQIEILLRIGNTEMIGGLVTSNELDLGLVEGPVTRHRLKIERFMRDELVVIVPSHHPWSDKKEISPQDLIMAQLIVREPGSGTRKVIEETLLSAGLDWGALDIEMELGSSEAIKGAVEAGLGIGIVSKWTLLKEMKLGSLVPLRIAGLPIYRNFNMIYTTSKFLPTTTEQFIKNLRLYGHALPET